MLWLLILLALPLTSASPLPAHDDLCFIPLFGQLLCHRSSPPSVNFNRGKPVGQPTSNGVLRYSVKYASAQRWASPVMSTTWSSPNPSDPTALPQPCPQVGLDPSQYSEDCLDLVLYVPPTAKTTPGGIPTLVWIHGGSFIVGSATAPGLDGSSLAIGANAIVAVIQYRLGTLGLLPPSAASTTSNLALQDVMTALTFLHAALPSFGSSNPQLTLAGQSSGASIVRALLGTPAAAPLFTNAWLHSDTIDYGFLSAGALGTVRNAWVSELGCASASGCAQSMDLSTLMEHENNLLNSSPSLGPEFFPNAPLRPSPAGVFMSQTFTRSDAFPSGPGLKPLVVTTVKDEATYAIYSAFPDAKGPLPAEAFAPVTSGTLGDERTATIVKSNFYPCSNTTDARTVLATLGTDQVWRCPGWKLARDWAAHGAHKQYAGVFTLGASYPGNSEVPECAAAGAVCHQDDIEVLFGTAPAETGTAALTKEVQARYAAFMRTGAPNAKGYAEWQPASAHDAKAVNLGGHGTYAVGACAPAFWGEDVQFDYQVLRE